ncbi:hypothetical protein N7603_06785 [Acholeplasma vituli]|uniref:Tripartite tricarboxylate transporter TctB family protein n=1 Tax=Paracholeplasma vituli TaxID=69473 RepID=A0ABT2PWL9_9MOLU|nr:hypothetical protein [Paracholeplasma vituli]MCU0105358.1 hypothetical protein [Paracholeplasma vituli]
MTYEEKGDILWFTHSFNWIFEVVLILTTYLGIYLGLETLFYPTNPQGFPADQLRIGLACFLYILFLGLIHTKLTDFWKAALFVGPNCVAVIAIILTFYDNTGLFLALTTLFVLLSLIFMVKKKVVWYYYFALVIGIFLGLFYAWPP